MEVCFDADQMFGTNVCTTENDDWLNIYANYDLEARRVCDTLEMYLQRGNGDEEAFKYRLSAEEQALLLPKMDAYCQTRLGQTLRGLSVGAEPGVPRDADVSVFVAVANLQACFSFGMVIAFPRQV